MKIKNDEGKEIEVFTEEELNKKIEEANKTAVAEELEKKQKELNEDFEKKIKDKDDELEKMKTDLEKLNAKDDDDDDDDDDGDDNGQVKRLKQKIADLSKGKDDLAKDFESKIKEINERVDSVTNNFKNELVSKVSKEDTKLKEKVDFYYDKLTNDKKPETNQEVTDIVRQSVLLATDGDPKPGVLDNIMTGKSGDDNSGDGKKQGESTENEKEIGKIFGVNDEDREKYANDTRVDGI
jgi:predicted phage tail protein